jgi:hypothetical protein
MVTQEATPLMSVNSPRDSTSIRLIYFEPLVKGDNPIFVLFFKKPVRLSCYLILVCGLNIFLGCASSPPENKGDICAIFEEKGRWYKAAKRASQSWGSPIPVMMAIIYQESGFERKAQPPRKRFLWIFPGPRPSTAYGYSQALDMTWDAYRQDTGNHGADRDDFGDAIDFVGWYNYKSHKRCGIKPNDAYHLYLAYHEGQEGFNRRTYKNKAWLKKVAEKVSKRSNTYRHQLERCQKRLEGPWWWPF